jgi:hypothetical protein
MNSDDTFFRLIANPNKIKSNNEILNHLNNTDIELSLLLEKKYKCKINSDLYLTIINTIDNVINNVIIVEIIDGIVNNISEQVND